MPESAFLSWLMTLGQIQKLIMVAGPHGHIIDFRVLGILGILKRICNYAATTTRLFPRLFVVFVVLVTELF